jgi:hypothetical protein
MVVTKKDVSADEKPEVRADTSAEREKKPPASKGATYAYVGSENLAVVVVGNSAYDFRKGAHVHLPNAAAGLENHPDFVKVKE